MYVYIWITLCMMVYNVQHVDPPINMLYDSPVFKWPSLLTRFSINGPLPHHFKFGSQLIIICCYQIMSTYTKSNWCKENEDNEQKSFCCSYRQPHDESIRDYDRSKVFRSDDLYEYGDNIQFSLLLHTHTHTHIHLVGWITILNW